MKSTVAIALLSLTLPAAAQTDPRPLPPGSFQYDGAQREFTPPSPVTIGDGPRQLPPGSFRFDGRQNELKPFGAPPKPQPEPEKKPAKSIG